MTAIGKYRILEEIGASAAGKTFRARDTFRNRKVALKVFDSTAAANAQVKSQFCRELGACMELQHPHIVRIRDAGEADGAIYVATELLTGVDLWRHFQEHRFLPLAAKLELMAQVFEALALAHRHGIAHGNIKPSNIFLVAGDDARILDFGSGRWLASMLEAGGRLAGLAPNHFAPEQILGQPFDTRSDVFSGAMLLYQLLVDKYPFPAPDSVVPREIVHSEPELLRKLDPQIPEELEQLVERALSKDPQGRLQTAKEFAAGLRRISQQLEPKQAAAVISVETAVSSLPPETPKKADKSVAPAPIRPAPAAKVSYFRKRVLTYTVAAILALGIAGTFLARQSMHATQPESKRAVPVSPARPMLAHNEPVRAVETPKPQPPPEEAQLGTVKSLWESGQYAQAMTLVNEVLAKNPDSPGAHTWKRKIRVAQDAESAMK
jgi:serine/threonine-protein kinase